MKKIKLNKGKFAIIDDIDFLEVSKNHWYFNANGYARTSTPKKMYLHVLVNKTPKGFETDHINRNKLDNRRMNLRSVNSAENKRNVGKYTNNKSGFKGVCWDKNRNKWKVQIEVNKKNVNLGRFLSIEAAVLTRKKAEREYYGVVFN